MITPIPTGVSTVTPVHPLRSDGLVAPSIAALDTYWGQLKRVYGNGSIQPSALVLDKDAPLVNLKNEQVENMDAWVNAVLDNLPQE